MWTNKIQHWCEKRNTCRLPIKQKIRYKSVKAIDISDLNMIIAFGDTNTPIVYPIPTVRGPICLDDDLLETLEAESRKSLRFSFKGDAPPLVCFQTTERLPLFSLVRSSNILKISKSVEVQHFNHRYWNLGIILIQLTTLNTAIRNTWRRKK